jgi:hypothetical protein
MSGTVLSKIPFSVFPNIGSTTLSDQKAQSWHFSKLGALLIRSAGEICNGAQSAAATGNTESR